MNYKQFAIDNARAQASQFTPDQIEAMHQDYLRELATETGFGAPKLWNKNAPRSFAEYVKTKARELWTFIPSHDVTTDGGLLRAVPECWHNEETGEVVWEDPMP